MMKKMMFSCKEATNLLSQKEDEKLNSLDKLRLNLHLSMCKSCSLFAKQTQIFNLLDNYYIEKEIPKEHLSEITNKFEKELKK